MWIGAPSVLMYMCMYIVVLTSSTSSIHMYVQSYICGYSNTVASVYH